MAQRRQGNAFMTENPRRLRRCALSAPGASEKMIAKAAQLTVDQVILDLEDSVAPTEKDRARSRVVEALAGLDWGAKTVAVRINDLASPHAEPDIAALVQCDRPPDLIVLPKAQGPDDIRRADALLGAAPEIGLEVLIEDVVGMTNLDAIAGASERLETLGLGFLDYAASQGMRLADLKDTPGDPWYYARNRVIVAARAHGLEPMDGPFVDMADMDGLSADAKRARGLGATGKWAIHPAQIPVIQEIFTPTEEEVAQARRIEAVYREAEAGGRGAIQVDGQMVDAATLRILRRTLDLADLLGI